MNEIGIFLVVIGNGTIRNYYFIKNNANHKNKNNLKLKRYFLFITNTAVKQQHVALLATFIINHNNPALQRIFIKNVALRKGYIL